MNPYVSDILAQPGALRDALRNYSPSVLEGIADRLKRGDFDRVIVSGMGSSYNAAYPGFLQLSNLPIPIQLINASELLHSLNGIIGARTLLWLNSQSGRSAEPVHLLQRIGTRRPACILTFVNDLGSPMASFSDTSIPINAGQEATVSTKTYLNMLTVNLLAAVQLSGGRLDLALKDLQSTADLMDSYLSALTARVEELDRLLGGFEQLFLLGRGGSLSAVWNGSLINQEAAQCVFPGMHAADFRHGPLELVSKSFAALIFSGDMESCELNRKLALEIVSHRGRVIWIDTKPDPVLPTLLLPKTAGLARPLLEILPMQVLTLVMADRKKLQAGEFRTIGKVTATE